MFQALNFTYDGKSSTDYGLVLASLSSSNSETLSIGIPLEIQQMKVKNNPKPYFFGVQTGENLSFEIELIYVSPDPENPELTRQGLGSILKWLLKREYKEFKILDENYSNIVYNCIFTEPKQINYGKATFGIQLQANCDRPYGFRKQTITKNVVTTQTFNLNNLGFDNDYVYPEVEFTMGAGGGDFEIKNNSEGGRSFKFLTLAGNETIYVNNARQEIISSNSVNRNTNFNFTWFRLLPSPTNSITVNGTGTVTFRMEFPMPM